MAYPKSFSAYPLFGGTQWPFALKAFRKVDVAGVIHDIGHFGTAYSGIYLVLLFVLLIAYVYDRAFVVAEPTEVLEADSPAVMLMIIEPIHCARLAFV